MMKKIIMCLVLAILNGAPAWADMDEALEAQEQAKRKAIEAEQKRKDAEVKALKSKTEMTAKRQFLGKEAEGTSDAEVLRLYERKLANMQQAPKGLDALGRQMQKKEIETRSERDAAVKDMYGKSLKELENMSDDEADALAKELEKKYGR